jgi:hypothetical protein
MVAVVDSDADGFLFRPFATRVAANQIRLRDVFAVRAGRSLVCRINQRIDCCELAEHLYENSSMLGVILGDQTFADLARTVRDGDDMIQFGIALALPGFFNAPVEEVDTLLNSNLAIATLVDLLLDAIERGIVTGFQWREALLREALFEILLDQETLAFRANALIELGGRKGRGLGAAGCRVHGSMKTDCPCAICRVLPRSAALCRDLPKYFAATGWFRVGRLRCRHRDR